MISALNETTSRVNTRRITRACTRTFYGNILINSPFLRVHISFGKHKYASQVTESGEKTPLHQLKRMRKF